VPVEPTMQSKTHGSILEFKPPAAAEDPQEANRAFIAALRAGDPRAREVLVERYLPLVQRLVAGAMGVESDLVDVVQDVFVAVLEGVHKLKDPSALQSWIASLAVFTARGRIRRKRRWRWIMFVPPESLPDIPVRQSDGDTRMAVRATYRALDTLPTDERMAFAMRFIAEMELTEVAAACRVSLATIKRRLARAEARFLAAAQESPVLKDRVDRGRWASK
jgi:RNA polymerase sigma-70 factor (ECF subfamily)